MPREFDDSELKLFQRRFEEGYNVIKEDDPVDARYNVWLSMQCKWLHNKNYEYYRKSQYILLLTNLNLLTLAN